VTGTSARETTARWTPWRTVAAFGLVSLSADMVYEGMRSVAGPFLGSLGASALTVGIVTGAGEAIALALRVLTGPLADRSGRYWGLTVAGYAMTAVCVPLLAVTPYLGAAGLAVACTLILLERTGKAVRSPSKSALLAHMAKPVGRGKGIAVHKSLDQIGAFAGPLVVAGMLALTGLYWPGFAILAIPGVVAMLLLAQLRRRTALLDEPAPGERVPGEPVPGEPASAERDVRRRPARLPRAFFAFALSCAAGTLGLMTFGVISFHLVDAGLLTAALVPVVYAMAMGLEALAALATGFAYDRWEHRVLLLLPLLIALVPPLAFAGSVVPALLGVAAWGFATGIQDSTVKALVADLLPASGLATAYGAFAAFQGGAALAGGVLAGALYADHLGLLIAVVAVLQALSLGLLLLTPRLRTAVAV
jgi:MFS family permease